MGKNEMGSPMNASMQQVLKINLMWSSEQVMWPDTRLEVKKSLPEAKRFTQSAKDRRNSEQFLKR